MDIVSILHGFLEPKSVALIGVTRKTGPGSMNILENLISYGFSGKLFPVNPNTKEILGMQTYPDVASIKQPIDLAIIATPRELVPRMLKECADNGILRVIIYAQGFNDADDDTGKKLQKELEAIIKSSQVRVIGPNTFGTANAYVNFDSCFVKSVMIKQPIGVICQTGVFFMPFLDRPLLGKGLDIGNACDINVADCIDYFAQDDQVKAIAIHIEGTKNPQRFLESTRKAAVRKPVIVLKTGKSEGAARAAQSHTGSLTGSNEVWDAALKQAGAIRADDFEELIDLAYAFSILPLMKGNRIAIATMSGGTGIATMDSCQYYGLQIAGLSIKTLDYLKSIAPPFLKVGNPVDIWPIMMGSKEIHVPLSKGIDALLDDDSVDAVIYTGAATDGATHVIGAQLFKDIAERHPDKPVVCQFYGSRSYEMINDLLDHGKVLAFPTPERAVRALGRLYRYSLFRRGL